jgi:hypothetical protein
MFFDTFDPSGYDAGDLGAPLDCVDGKTEHREPLGDRFGIVGQRDEIAQPAYRNAHNAAVKRAASKNRDRY